MNIRLPFADIELGSPAFRAFLLVHHGRAYSHHLYWEYHHSSLTGYRIFYFCLFQDVMVYLFPFDWVTTSLV